MKKSFLFLVLLFFATLFSQGANWYVDPSGTDNGSHGTTSGTGAFKTIGYALGFGTLANGDVIKVGAGTYIESNLIVSKSVTIQGMGATRNDVIIVPAAEDGNVDFAFASTAQNGFIIRANGVYIKKLTINGRGNPALTAGKNNFRAGIVTDDLSGTWNNLHVDDVYIKYTYRRGISVFPTDVIGTLIENSKVEYVAFNQGMYLAGQSQAINNNISYCFQGIVQALDASTPPLSGLIKASGNTLSHIGNFAGCYGYPSGQPRAIQFDPMDPVFRTVEIKDNIIDDLGSVGNAGTIGIYTRRANSSSIIENNIITLASGASHSGSGGSQSVGLLLGWSYTNGFNVRLNQVYTSGYGLGMLIFAAGSSATPMILENNTLTSSSSLHAEAGDGTGIYVANQYLFGSTNKNESYVIIQNHNAISGFQHGIDVEKVGAVVQPITVIAHNNAITSNPTGIDASTLPTSIDVINNWWGSAAGPFHPVLNPLGDPGTAVTNNESFIPWWCDAAMTSKCSPLTSGNSIMNLNTGVQYTAAALLTALTNALDGETLYVMGPVAGAVYNFGSPAKTVYIVGNGIPGQSVIAGASPAITVTAGSLIISGIDFTNTSNTPTILVNGGNLKLRNCIIHGTTFSGASQACLKVTSGTVDAGTLADHGLNKFLKSGTGSAIENTLSLPTWYAIGNDWGSPTGPTVSTNPTGTGGAILYSVVGITDKVIYRPWGGYTMSGNYKYYNSANTPLTTGVTVKLYKNGIQFGSDYAVTAGTYAFTDLVFGTYELRATSTTSTIGSVNATDAAQVVKWAVLPTSIEKVRFYAGDATGENYLNATDALRIQRYFVYGTPFDRPNWTFWETGKTISSNPSPVYSIVYPNVTFTEGSNKVANMYGLCTGDFNRSFTPAKKSGNSSLDINYNGTIQICNNQELDLPVRLVNASSIGAISLILNFPAEFVEVKDVTMNCPGGQLDWTVNGNELRIGWISTVPADLAAFGEMLTLRLKTTAAFAKGNSIRLTLASSPLNELADNNYDVIGDAIISVDVVEAAPNGIDVQSGGVGINIHNYPNPFANSTTITYTLPFNGNVILEIRNTLGNTVRILTPEFQAKGDHSLSFDAMNLAAGVYTATIKLSSKTNVLSSTIKLVISK